MRLSRLLALLPLVAASTTDPATYIQPNQKVGTATLNMDRHKEGKNEYTIDQTRLSLVSVNAGEKSVTFTTCPAPTHRLGCVPGDSANTFEERVRLNQMSSEFDMGGNPYRIKLVGVVSNTGTIEIYKVRR
jgi:hypothetical protein